MEIFTSILMMVLIIAALPCAIGCSALAGEKGYGSVLAFFAGLLFGVIGLIIYAGLPSLKLEHQMAKLIEWQDWWAIKWREQWAKKPPAVP